MLGTFGMPELIIIAIIAILIFGPKKLPQFGKAIGETIKELKNAGKEFRGIQEDAAAIEKEIKK